jgi:hypothetical protein
MALQPFTRNHEDNSTEAGFQFTFYCDLCHSGYKTEFIESKTYRKKGLFNSITKGISIGASLLGQHNLGYNVERGSDILSERFNGMSPEWHKEHEAAFEQAQNEAKGHFRRCPKCRLWVCEEDWNEQEGLCVECAPRMNVEMASIKAERMVQEMRDKAETSNLFKGEIESKTTLCPECGKPAGQGKFCNNCGANLSLIKCTKCGAKNSTESRFCGECGNKIR